MTRPSTAAAAAAAAAPFRLGDRPALDGLRAIAVGMVLWHHLNAGIFRRADLPQGGTLGVDVFFVLSGFLITTLLPEERDSTGRIAIGAFYRRRALRLLPAC